MNNPRVDVNKIHIDSHRKALSELSREELEAFALVEYGLTIFYACEIVGEDAPNVGYLTTFGMDFKELEKATDVVNRVIIRAKEIAEAIKRGN